ncbi:hypothetical protein HY947_05945 [Candidatus Gottesmanbacteria bacterium]|nr:hypothetical protein [Candidatus Gottesmanbacteria bacterium]
MSLVVTWYQFGLLFVTAYLFSYWGNVFSLKSIAYAPNPGYSLVLSKSYVVFTTLAAILLFGSDFSIKAGISILLIIIGSAFVMIGKPKVDQSHVRASWLPFAFGSFFCWGMLALMSKYLLQMGVPIYTRLIYVQAIVSIFILNDMRRKHIHLSLVGLSQDSILLVIGIFASAFNYFMQLGFQLAPNIGYVNAVNASSIAVVSLGAAYFFHDELTKRKLLGILIVTGGLILLVV